MNCRSKKIDYFIVFIILILISVSAGGCSNDLKPQSPQEQEVVDLPDQESWDSTLITSKLGKSTAEIWFGHMKKYNERSEYEFDQNVHVKFYNEDGSRRSTVTSEKGFLNEDQRSMELMGNVVAHSDSANMTLYTEELFWDEKREKIVSNEFVTITTETDTLYGTGFESNADLTNWFIKKPHGHSSRPIDVDIEKKFEKKPKSENE